jgi:hypothetical protein
MNLDVRHFLGACGDMVGNMGGMTMTAVIDDGEFSHDVCS